MLSLPPSAVSVRPPSRISCFAVSSGSQHSLLVAAVARSATSLVCTARHAWQKRRASSGLLASAARPTRSISSCCRSRSVRGRGGASPGGGGGGGGGGGSEGGGGGGAAAGGGGRMCLHRVRACSSRTRFDHVHHYTRLV
eukprot:4077709-Prymnesium_polylepis.2